MNHNTEGQATLTWPASAVHDADASSTAQPRHREQHRQVNWLRDVILGGQDGLVNILGIVLGVIAGGGSKAVLLAAGFAAAITESISMGAVGYTSTVSERDYYQAEQAREEAEIDATPEAERQEIRDIYAAKGFTGDLLDRDVDIITARFSAQPLARARRASLTRPPALPSRAPVPSPCPARAGLCPSGCLTVTTKFSAC